MTKALQELIHFSSHPSAKGYTTEQRNGTINEFVDGGDDEHVVIADGAGG